MKVCSRCKVEKPFSAFYLNKSENRYQSRCRLCVPIAQAERYANNADVRARRAESNRRWQENNPLDKNRVVAYNREKRTGFTPEEYRAKLIEQEGVCAICHGSSDRQLCADHDHETGVKRGLLCQTCNRVLGLVNDDAALLWSMIQYLKRYYLD